MKRALKRALRTLSWLFVSLSGCALLGACAASTLAPEPRNKPNIILVLADDAGVEAFPSYGAEGVDTPNLDRLAERGTLYTRMFSQPLCTPSRVELLTGKPNSENYTAFGWLDPSETTLAQKLKALGYRTAISGKWQLSAPEFPINYDRSLAAPNVTPEIMREHYGFDRYSLWQMNHGLLSGTLGSRYWGPQLEQDGVTRNFSQDEYGPSINVSYLETFITEAVTADEPFFAYYASTLPHDPWQPTPLTAQRGQFETNYSDPAFFRENVSYLDRLMGRLMDHVERLGVSDETVFIFVSDNGTSPKVTMATNSGDIVGGKGILSLRGTHVPLIISGPEFGIGVKDDRPLVLADLHKMLLNPGADGLPDRGTNTPVEFTYDAKGKAFPADAMTLIGRYRRYASGNVTYEQTFDECCIAAEVSAANDEPETSATP